MLDWQAWQVHTSHPRTITDAAGLPHTRRWCWPLLLLWLLWLAEVVSCSKHGSRCMQPPAALAAR
jgi:hypothetical protein